MLQTYSVNHNEVLLINFKFRLPYYKCLRPGVNPPNYGINTLYKYLGSNQPNYGINTLYKHLGSNEPNYGINTNI